MPHLSPMNWVMALISITLILITLMSILWWNNNLEFKHTKSPSKSSSSKWSW